MGSSANLHDWTRSVCGAGCSVPRESCCLCVAVLTALHYSFLEISQKLCLFNLNHSVYRLDVFGVDGP